MKAFDTISASFATQHRTFAKTRIKLAGLIDIQARNDACRAGGDGYRSPAAPPVTPVAIFAGSTGWARWRLVRETAWLLAPFVLITAMWGWAMYTGMQLEQASADAQCAE